MHNFIERYEKFERQFAALQIVVLNIIQTASLLSRLLTKEEISLSKKDNGCIQLALTHYVVNNLAALFDNHKKDANSLIRITKRFEKDFPGGFFSEYTTQIENFQRKHITDLERVEKNRNLSSAHLGANEEEELGWSSDFAKRIDRILGTKSSVAKNNSLVFITASELSRMSIIMNIEELEDVLEGLQYKTFTLPPVSESNHKK